MGTAPQAMCFVFGLNGVDHRVRSAYAMYVHKYDMDKQDVHMCVWKDTPHTYDMCRECLTLHVCTYKLSIFDVFLFESLAD